MEDLRFNTAPNFLTLFRMALVPVVIGLLTIHEPAWDLVAALLFGFASITDYFDGYLARTTKAVTVYGKLMDPLADKFLVVSSLIMLLELGRIHPIIVIILVCRELAITGLRALASAEGVIIAASFAAKFKTVTQMIATPFIMVKQGLWGIPLFDIGMVLLYVSILISVGSAIQYFVRFVAALKKKRKEKKQKNPRSS